MKTIKQILNIAILLFSILIFIRCTQNKRNESGKAKVIESGTVWNDMEGNVINAHGGGILYHEGTYYWYGENKGDSTYRLEWVTSWECWRAETGGVSCYSSKDLLNWKFEGMALPSLPNDTTSDLHPSQVIERPKVIYNDKTGKFVMWMHIESPDYEKAHSGVAISDSPAGPFTYLGSFKPNGQDCRDQTLFKDDDGRAYHIYSSEWNKTLYISLLNEDYTQESGTFTRNFINESREAPAVFKHQGIYYLISSGCTGWDPNVAEYATADSMLGAWTTVGNPCIGKDADSTFFAQSTFVFPVAGKEDAYVAMFDRWNKTNLIDSRYIWLPLQFKDSTIEIEWKDQWTPVRAQDTEGMATGLKQPVAVFNNWSAYDELSDNIPQTEELAMRLLDEVIRLKKQGVQFDYYVMDAFWFDVDGGYRIWNKKNWPKGPKRWLETCKANGIKPGLWFSTNLIEAGGSPMLNIIPEWESSATSDKATLSLFEGGYLNHLMETLQMYAEMGFKAFKFDFAYFDAATDLAKQTTSPTEIEALNKRAFIQAVKQFRAKNPDVIFIGYNGFGGDMENTITPFRKTVDPRWLEIFETLYCGDPRISDVPMMNFWRSQDLYSDHQVRQFAFNGLPLSRIDNCSFMIGTTGTCYKRESAAWKGALILSLARGGWLNVYHGNLELLNDADAAWFGRVQKTYMQLQQFGQTLTWGAMPGTGNPYGYQSSSPEGLLFTVVNPSQSIQEIDLPNQQAGRILFHDSGFQPSIQNNKLLLGPEQLAVVGFGKYNSEQYDWHIEKDIVIPEKIEALQAKIQLINEHAASVRITPVQGTDIRVLFSQCDETGKPFRSWGGAPPNGTKMNEFLVIDAKQGEKILPITIHYDKMIWSGLSWAAGEIKADDIDYQRPIEITCTSKEGKSKYFRIETYGIVEN